MIEALAEPRSALRGVPFLDGGFQHGHLVAAVLAVRHVRGVASGRARGVTSANIAAWLAPARAALLNDGAPRLPAVPLRSSGQAAVREALTTAEQAFPEWAPLLDLPVRFAGLHSPSGAISASMRAWPQHVLLAPEAFDSQGELAEQVLHEMCHQWMYLVMEVWPLACGDDSERVTLPSGTAGRRLWEALGAAHVAATLIRWYSDGPFPDPERVAALRSYSASCLALVPPRNLTPAGEMFAGGIKEVL